MYIRTSTSLLLALLPAIAALPACVNAVDRDTEAHAADTRAKDDQATKIRDKDEKSGPKDTTQVVGRDSVKVDGG